MAGRGQELTTATQGAAVIESQHLSLGKKGQLTLAQELFCLLLDRSEGPAKITEYPGQFTVPAFL